MLVEPNLLRRSCLIEEDQVGRDPGVRREDAGRRPPARARLPRAQTEGRHEPSRSAPVPEATTRPHRLYDAQERAAIDIGATLAQTAVTASRTKRSEQRLVRPGPSRSPGQS